MLIIQACTVLRGKRDLTPAPARDTIDMRTWSWTQISWPSGVRESIYICIYGAWRAESTLLHCWYAGSRRKRSKLAYLLRGSILMRICFCRARSKVIPCLEISPQPPPPPNPLWLFWWCCLSQETAGGKQPFRLRLLLIYSIVPCGQARIN